MPIPLSVQTYSNLDKLDNINIIRNSYNKKGIIYGIVTNLNNKIYVGSTTDTNNRFYTHFIKPKRSNKHLQSSIKLIGLSNFTLHIFTVIELSDSLSPKEKRDIILPLEQKYLDMFPKSQLYNFLLFSSSPLGFKHSDETKLLMSTNSKGNNLGIIPVNKGNLLSDLEK
jgi:group I intron endonuclease